MTTQIKPKPLVSGIGKTISIDALLASVGKARELNPSISIEDYAEAVLILVKLAQTDSGGARVAAQVLLSLYNGNNWHVDLTDLCNLDCTNYRAALDAIRGRVEFSREPQRMIENGEAIFDQLEAGWQAYHVRNRYADHYR